MELVIVVELVAGVDLVAVGELVVVVELVAGEELMVVVELVAVMDSMAVVAAKVEGAAVGWGFPNLQRNPHHQYPYDHSLEIAFGLLVGDHDDEAGLEWGAD
jgi:hypothetical protein